MEWFSQNQQQSRLGQILVKKKLISDEQLKNAIARQASTGERPGYVSRPIKMLMGEPTMLLLPTTTTCLPCVSIL